MLGAGSSSLETSGAAAETEQGQLQGRGTAKTALEGFEKYGREKKIIGDGWEGG